ncbi:Protein eyes shut homolog,Neurogenic locus Notch protein,Neurogenic locus notch homolog protein 3,Protein eyes shut,Delta and Notch-like epidermal growth factor-related receptor,Delta-like protein C,Neurogenic locus notch homolog protein 1,Fibropellin-3,Protein crumbs homolog 2,Sushi, nidogen and EGF-like domain-containing protein 1,Protein jagged-1a,Sushi, von Willebrand factor type A, EGF and pentraxin domain-containing protein 1,Neurogenic locus notch homolog protein 2,Delta-like protein B,Protein crumb|uniref:EGF-like domain-containing protein n=1 Tax=Mytilus coruscus TaxID=42192 RepID=A0A6J8CHM7_MYTCO|nr:Protein eyes shut homolog,Neurogenic locus Notch protein,Neurogenic locus notch homolog protein 3,Protein eyes shut,Delta and Notch-like epidermal growth factor-related receptor,Delta-like protein C,Neurogenic locus notch homolog protein 1,Fibropellin-3,Protein crumbs homolog 2,Sushi, nidogen and EGF-like domain-containing protein 1,Protein jagged-1a,Sushi, von Willebrand factor type A, EGF and pentraxin domain-containing protein 1,Neurogenic locus notch homolog protein 2,Delta-like protein B,Pr
MLRKGNDTKELQISEKDQRLKDNKMAKRLKRRTINYTVEFKYKLAWRYNAANSATWRAGSSLTAYSGPYVQTGSNAAEDWEEGEKTFSFNFPTNGPYRLSYASGNWINLAHGSASSWNLQTVVDLHHRSDTYQPNYSPLTTSRAIYRVQYGCPVSIKLPIIDPEGDNVQCRWATQSEAATISRLLPNAQLDEKSCTLTFTANSANSYTNNGWFAVALTIEDFPRKTITINNRVYSPSTPITQIPLQFLIHTETMLGSCDDKPVFVSPTLAEGHVTILKATTSFSTGFYVKSDAGLKSIDISGPQGLSKSSILADDQVRSNVRRVVIQWTPTQADQGTHIICASAEDNNKKLSDTRCISVIAWDVDPCETSPCRNNGTCNRLGYTSDYTCHCVPGFTGRQCQTDINECFSNPCQHGATCTDLVNGYTCRCSNGYTGIHCETDIDECFSNPCDNNSTCVDGIASWNCACIPGFTGTQCQTDIDECSSSPCQHNGTCKDFIDEYICQCTNESKGDNCEKWLDHCSSGPCLHSGECTNEFGGYSCDCPEPWYGDICENKEINKTEDCTDLEYTDCSCFITKINPLKRKSYKMETGIIGLFTGLLGTIVSYIIWTFLGNKFTKLNKIHITDPNTENTDIMTVRDFESEVSSNYNDDENRKDAGNKENTNGLTGCDCFLDHTGYDHFQRFDEKLRYKYKFHKHNCRDKKQLSKSTSPFKIIKSLKH